MDIKIQYDRAGKPWLTSEDTQIRKEYVVDKLDLMTISTIHKRLPGGIISRLHKLCIVDKNDKPRGYNEYTESELFRLVSERQKELYKKHETSAINEGYKFNKEGILKITTDPLQKHRSYVQTSIGELKNDIAGIKKDIAKILELMNAIYEFENSDEKSE